MDTKKLQDGIIAEFKKGVDDAWDKMTKEDMDLLKDLAKDAAKLQLKSLTSDEDLKKEIKIVNASLLNLTIAKYFPVKKVFWGSVKEAASFALSILMKAAAAAI